MTAPENPKSGSNGSAGFLGLSGLGSHDRAPPPTLFAHPNAQASPVNIGGATSSAPSTSTNTAANTTITITKATTKSSSPHAATSAAAQGATVTGSSASRDFTSPTVALSVNLRQAEPALVAPSIQNTPSISSLTSTPLRSARSADRTDALWAEMQATLEEVEFSATGSAHVFRAEHEKKLADLRVAQIALAQAWTRSESDDPINVAGLSRGGNIGDSRGEVHNLKDAALGSKKNGEGSADLTTAAGPSLRPDSNMTGKAKGVISGIEPMDKMEDEMEVDILLARNRREANDRYFRRVNQGVIDVVSKLANVADAMRKVEAETKDIWGEGEIKPSNGQ